MAKPSTILAKRNKNKSKIGSSVDTGENSPVNTWAQQELQAVMTDIADLESRLGEHGSIRMATMPIWLQRIGGIGAGRWWYWMSLAGLIALESVLYSMVVLFY